MRTTTKTHASSLATLLRVLVIAVLVALLVPAFALADESGTAVIDPPATEAPVTEAPASGQPVSESPANQPTEPAAEAPVPEAPPAEPVVQEPAPTPVDEAPAPPPASEAPVPVDSPTPAPAPATPINIPILTPILEPVLAPTLPELTPGMGSTPDDPGIRPVVSVVAPPAAPPVVRIPGAPAPPPTATTTPTAPSPGLGVDALGTPAAPDAGVVGSRSAPRETPDPLLLESGFGAALADTFNPTRAIAPVANEASAPAAPSAIGSPPAIDPEAFGAVRAVAPQGSVSNGASLLEVLAGFVMPGSTGPPASSIVFLILLGTLLLAAYAPRPQMSERLHLLGLMGPRSGHAMAVRRPG